jgi:lipid-binding SYLF domain-containing protein
MKNLYKQMMAAALGLALIFSVTAAVPAQNMPGKNTKKMKEGRKEAKQAARVLNEMMKKPDDFIPRELLERAHAIAVIPDVVKAAFIVGGRGGDGIVSRRTATGWSVPVFYDMGGASYGAQIGVKKTDYIMLFMNEGALRDLLDEKVEFGGDVSFAAGPVGRTAGVGTNPTLDAGILTWSRSEGAFLGASVKGAVLTADNDLNRAVYGLTAKDVLDNPAMVRINTMPSEIRVFLTTLTKYAGSKTMGSTINDQPEDSADAENFYLNGQSREAELAKTRSMRVVRVAVIGKRGTSPRHVLFTC